MTTEKKRVPGPFADVIRINLFYALYIPIVMALIKMVAWSGGWLYKALCVVAEIGLVIGFVAMLPRVSVGGKTCILTFRHRWQPYLLLIINGVLLGCLIERDVAVFEFMKFLFLTFLFFLLMPIPLSLCKLPRVLTWKTALGPFCVVVGVWLLSFLVNDDKSMGLSCNYIWLFLYITFSISAGLKRPHRGRLMRIILFIVVIAFAVSWYYGCFPDLDYRDSSGTVSSTHELFPKCKGVELPPFQTVGELFYWEYNDFLMGQAVIVFGESKSDLSLWLSHVDILEKRKKRSFIHCKYPSFPRLLPVDIDEIPTQIQRDFNLTKDGEMYCDTEWKEWIFSVRGNWCRLLFNPETRKFYLMLARGRWYGRACSTY